MIGKENKQIQLLKDIREYLKVISCSSTTPVSIEYDTILLCNPSDGSLVIASITYTPTGIPTATYYLPNGTIYAGPTPVNCDTPDLESDKIEGCAFGITYFQWVVKDNGQPNGTVYYTDASGVLVPAPVGFTPGPCNIRYSDEERICYSVLPSLTPLHGWKRFIKDSSGNILSIEILDSNNNVVLGATEIDCNYCPPTIEGDLFPLGQSLTVNRPYTVPVKLISVHNGTPDYVRVDVTLSGSAGNQIIFLNPGGAQNIGPFQQGFITNLDFTHMNILGNGSGIIIANAFAG